MKDGGQLANFSRGQSIVLQSHNTIINGITEVSPEFSVHGNGNRYQHNICRNIQIDKAKRHCR